MRANASGALLKADPSVDLVHFTILRPPDKQDPTPIDELSLIAFPTRELFVEKLDQFDLVIFDRYSERGILPLAYFENIARYVENGGALLVSSGPEFAQPTSIFRTPLASVLPAQPTGDVVTQAVQAGGDAAGLRPSRDARSSRRQYGTKPPDGAAGSASSAPTRSSGETLMSGPGDRPLLVLDRVGKGRVAELLSDQGWLWARGFEGGGPQAELLRRLAHWLMKEPELEEERLSAAIAAARSPSSGRPWPTRKADHADLSRRANRDADAQRSRARTVARDGEGRRAGLYRAHGRHAQRRHRDGPLNPKEVADMRATDTILKPVARATGGSVRWLADGGVPKSAAWRPDASPPATTGSACAPTAPIA
jgi:hypothetical protein